MDNYQTAGGSYYVTAYTTLNCAFFISIGNLPLPWVGEGRGWGRQVSFYRKNPS